MAPDAPEKPRDAAKPVGALLTVLGVFACALRSARKARGPRCDTPMTQLLSLVLFPVFVVELGGTRHPGFANCLWLVLLLLMVGRH